MDNKDHLIQWTVAYDKYLVILHQMLQQRARMTIPPELFLEFAYKNSSGIISEYV